MEVRRLVIALIVLPAICVALILVKLLASALHPAPEENQELEQMDDCSLPGYGYYTAEYWKEKEDEE